LVSEPIIRIEAYFFISYSKQPNWHNLIFIFFSLQTTPTRFNGTAQVFAASKHCLQLIWPAFDRFFISL